MGDSLYYSAKHDGHGKLDFALPICCKREVRKSTAILPPSRQTMMDDNVHDLPNSSQKTTRWTVLYTTDATGNVVPRKGLRVRVPCPPLTKVAVDLTRWRLFIRAGVKTHTVLAMGFPWWRKRSSFFGRPFF